MILSVPDWAQAVIEKYPMTWRKVFDAREEALFSLRRDLVEKRNHYVCKPFFLYRHWSKRKVADLDKEIDHIDLERRFLRRLRETIDRVLSAHALASQGAIEKQWI